MPLEDFISNPSFNIETILETEFNEIRNRFNFLPRFEESRMLHDNVDGIVITYTLISLPPNISGKSYEIVIEFMKHQEIFSFIANLSKYEMAEGITILWTNDPPNPSPPLSFLHFPFRQSIFDEFCRRFIDIIRQMISTIYIEEGEARRAVMPLHVHAETDEFNSQEFERLVRQHTWEPVEIRSTSAVDREAARALWESVTVDKPKKKKPKEKSPVNKIIVV